MFFTRMYGMACFSRTQLTSTSKQEDASAGGGWCLLTVRLQLSLALRDELWGHCAKSLFPRECGSMTYESPACACSTHKFRLSDVSADHVCSSQLYASPEMVVQFFEFAETPADNADGKCSLDMHDVNLQNVRRRVHFNISKNMAG
jgi:hypothetical protein